MAAIDRETVERMKAGDREAFEYIYRELHQHLYRMAYLISGNKADSEDILQETFTAIYLHRSEIKNPESFEKWAAKVLVRAAWRITKRAKRDASLDELLDKDKDGPGEGSGAGERLMEDKKSVLPAEEAVARVFQKELLSAIEELDVKLKTVIVLYYYNDLSVKEIAAVTGSFEGTVKSRLHKARNLLKEKLGNCGIENARIL